jgi:hypothetical protein
MRDFSRATVLPGAPTYRMGRMTLVMQITLNN